MSKIIKGIYRNLKDTEGSSTLPSPSSFNSPLKIMNQQEITNQLINKTYQELAQPPKTSSKSRVWQDPEGYRYLISWSNAVLLRFLIRKFTSALPKSEYRRKTQADDASRSHIRNIEEGFKRPTTAEYLTFLGYSQASLEEVKGDVRELTEDGFLKSKPGSSLASVGINLGDLHQALRKTKNSKGDYRNLKDPKGSYPLSSSSSSKFPLSSPNLPLKSSNYPLTSSNSSPWAYRPLTLLYPPLKTLQASDLTYEIFLELINKTDWNLRQLVQSLEKKLSSDQKYYQIEKARIRSNIKWQR